MNMNKRQNHIYRSESLSLMPLKVVLTNARNDLPPRAHTPGRDANEELASRLIEMMKLQFKKQSHPVNWMGSSIRHESGNSHEETAGTDVQ